jgi:hypothetical protein
MWMGDGQYKLAPALITLIGQLEKAYPATAWQTSPQTGTIGDAAHRAEGSASDHNPWLKNTVRALDVAAGTPGGPGAEALFAMVNRMYGARDLRVFPDGYAIFNRRITDWGHPGQYWAQQGDPHLFHVHISVSTEGYESTDPWPLSGESTATVTSHPLVPTTTHTPEEEMKPYLIRDGGGHLWVIRGDLSSRTQVSEKVAFALKASGSYAANPGFDNTTISHIPVAK